MNVLIYCVVRHISNRSRRSSVVQPVELFWCRYMKIDLHIPDEDITLAMREFLGKAKEEFYQLAKIKMQDAVTKVIDEIDENLIVEGAVRKRAVNIVESALTKMFINKRGELLPIIRDTIAKILNKNLLVFFKPDDLVVKNNETD